MKHWKTEKPSQLRPLTSLEWPSIDGIAMTQNGKVAPTAYTFNDRGVYVDPARKPWIPDQAEELLQRLMVIAHCRRQGHRGANAMIKDLEDSFAINNLQLKARAFNTACLLCCHIKGGKIVPRPYGELYRSSELNDALHIDYLYIGKYNDISDYILVPKDDYSHFCELIQCSNADDRITAKSILHWNMNKFGPAKILISDTATPFKNNLLTELCQYIQTQQDFTVAYCPWINGSVERVNRDILQILRVMVLEFRLRHEQWTDLLPLVQATHNQTAVQSLANLSPIEVFTRLERPSPLRSIVVTRDVADEQVVNLDEFLDHIVAKVDVLRDKPHNIYKKLQQDKAEQIQHNKRNQQVSHPVNFHVGDYVLWPRIESRLKALCRVIETKPNSFTVEHLISGSFRDEHGPRLKRHADRSFELTEEIVEHIVIQDVYLTVRDFIEHRLSDTHGDEVLVPG